jgi:hypothetical protein
MIRVLIGHRQRITKYSRCFVERNPMLPSILRLFARIPFKSHFRILLHRLPLRLRQTPERASLLTIVAWAFTEFQLDEEGRKIPSRLNQRAGRITKDPRGFPGPQHLRALPDAFSHSRFGRATVIGKVFPQEQSKNGNPRSSLRIPFVCRSNQIVFAQADSTTSQRSHERAIDLDWKCVLSRISRRGSQPAIPNS